MLYIEKSFNGESFGVKELLNEFKRSETVCVAKLRDPVVAGNYDMPHAVKIPAKAEERLAFGALDIYLEQVNGLDPVLLDEIVEGDRGYLHDLSATRLKERVLGEGLPIGD